MSEERLDHEAHEKARKTRKAFARFVFQTAPALQDAAQAELDALLLSVLDKAFRREL